MRKNISLIVTFLAVLALCAAGPGLFGAGGGNAALAERGGSSAGYTVDYTWQGATYSVRGQSSCALNSILYRLGISGETEHVRLDLAAGDEIEGALTLSREGNDWYLTSRVPFDSTYLLTAVVDGQNVVLKVTDAVMEDSSSAFELRHGPQERLIVRFTDEQGEPIDFSLVEGHYYLAGYVTVNGTVGTKRVPLTYGRLMEVQGDTAVEEAAEDAGLRWSSFTGYGYAQGYTLSSYVFEEKYSPSGNFGLYVHGQDSALTLTMDEEGTIAGGRMLGVGDPVGAYVIRRIDNEETAPEANGIRNLTVTYVLGGAGAASEAAAEEAPEEEEPAAEAAQEEPAAEPAAAEVKEAMPVPVVTEEELPEAAPEEAAPEAEPEAGVKQAVPVPVVAEEELPEETAAEEEPAAASAKDALHEVTIVEAVPDAPEEVPTVEYPIVKVWRDENNRDGVRPEYVLVQLYADKQPCGEPVKLTGGNTEMYWPYTFTGLPQFSRSGKEIVYEAREIALGDLVWRDGVAPGWYSGNALLYTSWYEAGTKEVNGRHQLVNQHEIERIDIEVVKSWADVSNRDGVRPTSVTLTLYGDGYPMQENGNAVTVTLNGVAETGLPDVERGEKAPWVATFAHLPKYRPGEVRQEIVYGVRETSMSTSGTYWRSTDGLKWTCSLSANPYVSSGWATKENNFRITNTYQPQTTGVTLVKVWEDGDNREGLRPASVEAVLLRNGEKVDTFVLSEQNHWTVSRKGLYKYEDGELIQYTWQESPAEYYQEDAEARKAELSEDGSETVTTIVNTLDGALTRVSVRHVWNDNADEDGLRQETVVRLMKQAGAGEASVQASAVLGTADTAEGQWSVTFENLPVYDKGEIAVYSVETDAPEGYTAEITGSAEEGFVIVYTHVPQKLAASVLKRWADKDNQDGKRPASVTVVLYADGEAAATAELSDGNNWGAAFIEMPVYRAGKKVVYTVEELLPDGWTKNKDVWQYGEDADSRYTETVSGDAETGFVIVNTHEPVLTDASVSKTWVDENNRDGVRPTELDVTLLANGEPLETYTLTRGRNWKMTVSRLPKYENGQEIAYTWAEDETAMGSGYTPAETRYDPDARMTEFVNTYSPETVDVTVVKVWYDHDNAAGKRPAQITAALSNGIETVETVTLSEDNRWSATVSGLPRSADGKELTYTWTEDTEVLPEGYTLSGIYTEGRVTTITNTYSPDSTALSVRKVWDDKNDQDGIRPASVTVVLLRNGTEVESYELNEENSWFCAVSELPRITDGTLNEYTWQEKTPEGYELKTEVTGTLTTLTNVHTPETMSLQVVKVWEDGSDRDGKRPTELDVTLYGDGEKVGTYTLTRGKDWTLTVPDLPRMKAGAEIAYSFEEAAVPEYELVSAETADGVTTLTNHYEFDKVSVSVTKVWNDRNAKEGVRPEQIEVVLLADGQEARTAAFGPEEGTEDGDTWHYVFTDLPKRDETGKEIVYTLREVTVPEYETVMEGDAETGFTVTNTYTASGAVQLTAVKQVSGEEPMDVDDIFTFEMYIVEVDEETMRVKGINESPIATVDNELGAITFPEIAYDLSEANRTYWFMISELVPEGSLSYEYDFTRYVAGVTVTDNGDGTLNTDTKWYSLDEDNLDLTEAPNGAVFNNLRAMPSSLTVTKTVVGNRTTRHFDFTANLKDENDLPLIGEYPYAVQDIDGRTTEEGTFSVGDGNIEFRLADGELIMISGLPLGASYTVREASTKAYITSTQDNGQTNVVSGTIVEGGAHIDFINTEVTTEFSVRKVWQGGDPGWSISLTLGTVSQGEFISLYPQPAYTREGNMYYFKDLPKYDEKDNLIVYAAKEAPITGYGLIKYSNVGSNVTSYLLDGGTVTNSKSMEFRVKIVWTGVKEDEELPEITLALWKVTGDKYALRKAVKTKVKNEQWYTFNGLEQGAVYYVTEDAVPGFSTTYDNGTNSPVTDHAENYGTIINHKLPRTGDNDPVGLWMLMAGTGLAGLAVLLILRRRKLQTEE